MKYTVLEYKVDGETVSVVSLKGYGSLPALADPAEGVARVNIESVEDLRSLGDPVLRAVFDFKAKKSAEVPAEHDEMAEVVWSMLNPPPKTKAPKPEKISGQKELQSSTDDGTSSSVAGESGVKKGRKKMAKAKKAAKKVAKKSNGAKGPRGEKTLKIKSMLERKSGCTRAQVLEMSGWTAVSMQAMAKACGLKLRKEKEPGKPIVYFGS